MVVSSMASHCLKTGTSTPELHAEVSSKVPVRTLDLSRAFQSHPKSWRDGFHLVSR